MTRHADPALPERRRRQILNAARACFAWRGLAGTTVEDICAEARISPGMLYRYFDARADILAALADEASSELETLLAPPADLAAALEAMAHRMAEDAALKLDLWAEAARDPQLAQALNEREHRLRAKLAAALERGSPLGGLEAHATAEALLTALAGLVLRRALDPKDANAPVRFRALAERLTGAMEQDDRRVEGEATDRERKQPRKR